MTAIKKEIIGIILFFLFVFIIISLVSYNPHDPSIHSAGPAGNIHNLFGAIGAHVSGLLVGLFGVGSFWLPLVLLFSSIQFLGGRTSSRVVWTLSGGLLLMVTTGALFSVQGNSFMLFKQAYSSGGLVGIPAKRFLVTYAGKTGGIIILSAIWLIGFVLTTGFSVFRFVTRTVIAARNLMRRLAVSLEGKKEKRARAVERKKHKIKMLEKKGPEIKSPKRDQKRAEVPKQELFEFAKVIRGFKLPSLDFLEDPKPQSKTADRENLHHRSLILEKKLEDFSVRGRVTAVTPGPVITTFEYEPAPGVKINKIVSLADDLALALRAVSIRIVAPIPGKSVIGIEVPNDERETVRFKELVRSKAFERSKSKLTLCLGKDIVGNPVVVRLDKMPHLLIAGATGAGKSVALNTMICSLLYKSYPDEVKFIMVDPKRIELSQYDGIPHLITPVVTDVKKATHALMWAVREMESRYEKLSGAKVRNIGQFNRKLLKEGSSEEIMPYIVVVIDELADLMMTASRDVEAALMRLAQMARAAGIHLILATQRPSVDVLTGVIKANFPTRLSFQVSSKTDSRTIIDTAGAENLLGNGDMLYLPPGTSKLVRIHGAYISETELARITEFLKSQKAPQYDRKVLEAPPEKADGISPEDMDEKYDEAVALVAKQRQASISMIQRHLRIGYNRAARIIEIMEKEGLVGPADGSKPREVLISDLDSIGR